MCFPKCGKEARARVCFRKEVFLRERRDDHAYDEVEVELRNVFEADCPEKRQVGVAETSKSGPVEISSKSFDVIHRRCVIKMWPITSFKEEWPSEFGTYQIGRSVPQ